MPNRGVFMADKITWKTEKRKIGDLIEWDQNPRQLSKHDYDHLKKSLDKFGVADPIIINLDGSIIGGHQRKKILLEAGLLKQSDTIDVRIPDRQLTDDEARELAIRLNRNQGAWDFDALANNFDVEELTEWGFTEDELLGVVYDNPQLKENEEEIRTREMMRVLVSVPLDSALDAKEIIEQLNEIENVEIIYGAN
jgi:ParB-like chromosome segregation protein Spo0J